MVPVQRSEFDVIVVGGGISGMWAAISAAKRDYRVAIISQDLEGGLIQSVKFGSGARADLGGHVYTTKDRRVFELVSAADGIIHDRKAVYLHGTVDPIEVPYPVQDHADLLGLSIHPGGQPSGGSLREWAVAKFGYEFVDAWYEPFNRRVWTVPTSEMSSDWVRDRVKVESAPKEAWGPNSTFIYAPGEDIAKVLKTRMFELGVTWIEGVVGQISPEDRLIRYLDRSSHFKEIIYSQVIWTISPDYLLKATNSTLDNKKSNVVATIAVHLDGNFSELYSWHWAYGNITSPVHRITNLSKYHPKITRNNKTSVFILEVPYRVGRSEPPGWSRGLDSVRSTLTYTSFFLEPSAAQDALRSVGLHELAHTILSARVMKFEGYPIPTLNFRSSYAGFKAKLFEHRVIVAGRWGDWGYYNMEHCMSSAEIAVWELQNAAPSPDYLYSTHYYSRF